MLLVSLVLTIVMLTVTAQINLTPSGIATQSSYYDTIGGKPENAVNLPKSNEYSLDKCSHTKEENKNAMAWWMFQFSFGTAYITDITIYYRENSARRMDGFKVYVTNTPNVPPVGHLCYEDPDPGLPNITQTIACNHLGQFVIYYDTKGSDEGQTVPGPIVELCYVAIHGCPKRFWGSNCEMSCAESCIEQHCYPGNGSCVLGGCSNNHCLNNNCKNDTEVCIEGCKGNRTGPYCNIYGDCSVDINTSVVTCLPKIDAVHPSSGPVNGGTLLTITGTYIGNVNDNINVDVSGVRCHNVTVATADTNLTCVIGKGSTTQTYGIFISVNANNFSNANTTYFVFKEAMISEFSPKKGVVSGGTTVVIQGSDLEFEGIHRYSISFCSIDTCIQCSAIKKTIRSKSIICKTGKSGEVRNMTKLQIVIDDLTVLTLNKTFQYLPDPTFELSNISRKAMKSGGATFTIHGDGFNNVGNIIVERVVKPCDVPGDTSAVCETPPKMQNQSNDQTVHVHFDGFILPINIVFVDDPTFEKFSGVLEYDHEYSIQIKGTNILNGARREDYGVQIGLDGTCFISDINMQFIRCFPPKSVPRTNKSDENTVHVIVLVSRITAYIGDLQYTEDDNKFSLVVGLLTGGLVISVFIGITAVLIARRNKKRAIKKYKMEMSKDLSERRKKSRNDNELGHYEESETPYSEINPGAELNSSSSIIGNQDVNIGYEELSHRSLRPTNPYNHLQQSETENQMLDTTNIDNRTKDLLASDYMNLKI